MQLIKPTPMNPRDQLRSRRLRADDFRELGRQQSEGRVQSALQMGCGGARRRPCQSLVRSRGVLPYRAARNHLGNGG